MGTQARHLPRRVQPPSFRTYGRGRVISHGIKKGRPSLSGLGILFYLLPCNWRRHRRGWCDRSSALILNFGLHLIANRPVSSVLQICTMLVNAAESLGIFVSPSAAFLRGQRICLLPTRFRLFGVWVPAHAKFYGCIALAPSHCKPILVHGLSTPDQSSKNYPHNKNCNFVPHNRSPLNSYLTPTASSSPFSPYRGLCFP